MRLDFNILWVDDQPDFVSGAVQSLKRIMAEEGFDLKPTFCETMNEVGNQLADEIFRDEIDLILVDWDLGAELKGQAVISEVRKRMPYRDVVFYSAHADIGILRSASFDERHGGVYFALRDELTVEVDELFHSMIKKVLDLDHTRGIVMGATSDVDQMARECLQLAHEMLDESGKSGVLAEMVRLLDSKEPGLKKEVDKLKARPSLIDILKAHRTFTANDSLRILKSLLDMPEFSKYNERQVSVKRYIKDILPVRNVLGHKVLTPEGKPAGIAGEAGQIISLQEMRELRRNLLELRNEFRLLHKSLSGRL